MSGRIEYVEVNVKLTKPVVVFIEKFTELVGDDLNDFVEMAVRSKLRYDKQRSCI